MTLTLGVFASAYTGDVEKGLQFFIKMNLPSMMKMTNQLIFDNALLSVASLNRKIILLEMAKDYTGNFIKISGSSVGEKKTGKFMLQKP